MKRLILSAALILAGPALAQTASEQEILAADDACHKVGYEVLNPHGPAPKAGYKAGWEHCKDIAVRADEIRAERQRAMQSAFEREQQDATRATAQKLRGEKK